MAVKFANRAKMGTATTGTGTMTLGSAVAGYQSFADAGVSDGDVVRYVIEDGSAWEIGTGTYTATGTTLSRTVLESSNADAAISLSGSAEVYVTAAASDILDADAAVFTGSIEEAVHTLTGTTPALDPANGTIQTWTLTANSTPTDSLAAGESLTLMVDDGTARTITWPTITWVGGSAPTLATTGFTVIVLWKVGSTLYGKYVGDA